MYSLEDSARGLSHRSSMQYGPDGVCWPSLSLLNLRRHFLLVMTGPLGAGNTSRPMLPTTQVSMSSYSDVASDRICNRFENIRTSLHRPENHLQHPCT
jgi:hypothetical protein